MLAGLSLIMMAMQKQLSNYMLTTTFSVTTYTIVSLVFSLYSLTHFLASCSDFIFILNSHEKVNDSDFPYCICENL